MGRRVFEVIIGIALLALAFGLALYFQQAYSRGVELKTLPVPKQEIAPYTILTESMFEQKDFPSALGGGFVTSLSQLMGRISNSKIPAGLPVAQALVSDVSDFRLADSEMEVISIPITPASAIGGKVQVGERVNIYRLSPPGRTVDENGFEVPLPASAEMIAQNIQVVAILSGSGGEAGLTGTGQDVAVQILVLAVTPEEASVILKLVAETKQNILMWISLAPLE